MGYTPADIKPTFLNGVVKEEVYIEQPLGVETHDRKNHACKYEMGDTPSDIKTTLLNGVFEEEVYVE